MTAQSNISEMIRSRTLMLAIGAISIAFVALVATATNVRAITIQEVEGNSGIKAWLVEDYTVPIITISASFRGGATQDPDGKEGMASLLSTLFDEGAGPYDSKDFQARLEKLGVSLRYNDSRDGFRVSLRTLKSDLDNAVEMMQLSLSDLHFEEDSISRMREALKARILRRENNPSTKAGEAIRTSLFGEHPYSRSSRGTIDGLTAISRGDLVSHFKRLFAKNNLTVGIVGAVNSEEAADLLDEIFGGLPETADLNPVKRAEISFGEDIRIEEELPQSTITLALPGVPRSDPEFFAAYLMNQILGGGSFSSRLYNEVREKRGLAYSVYSSLTNYDNASFLSMGSKTKSDRADETLSIMRAEIERMANDGPTPEELESAKKYVIGSYAINNLDTTGKIARALVAMQEEDLGRDYIDRRTEFINSVTLEDVKAVAKRLLSQKPTIVVVGPSAT
ncbi:MAG: M16 family metallopeptidase [Rhizobiaceae bacterium]